MIADAALDRLRTLKPGFRYKDDFTSALSVDEFTVVHDAGYEPVGLVAGSCIYHIGLTPVMWSASAEMTVLTQAMYEARNLAMSRLAQDAQALNADGVVGVRLTIDHEAWGEHLAEFVAIGTAVRKFPGLTTKSQVLPPQAIINDKNTWISESAGAFAAINKK